jgi:hypothetical protein
MFQLRLQVGYRYVGADPFVLAEIVQKIDRFTASRLLKK